MTFSFKTNLDRYLKGVHTICQTGIIEFIVVKYVCWYGYLKTIKNLLTFGYLIVYPGNAY